MIIKTREKFTAGIQKTFVQLKKEEGRIVSLLNCLDSNLAAFENCLKTVKNFSLPLSVRILAMEQLKRIKIKYPNPIEDISPRLKLRTDELEVLREELKKSRKARSNAKKDS